MINVFYTVYWEISLSAAVLSLVDIFQYTVYNMYLCTCRRLATIMKLQSVVR